MSRKGIVLVKWVRSGIGLPRSQKERVRSLGLRRLNHVVECPDNAHVRGLVACISHLVEIVEERPASPLAKTPEYTIRAAAPKPSPAGKGEPETTAKADPEKGGAEAAAAPAE